MIYINEWFPNPVGNDTAGEFVELYNNGTSVANLNGYTLSDGAKKKFSLSGYHISSGGYLVLKHGQDGLSLRNTNGTVSLYGPSGQMVDGANFIGAAPEGKSYSRVDYGAAPIAHFVFTFPTPGAKNKTIDTTVKTIDYPLGVSLSPQLSPMVSAGLAICAAGFFLLFFIYVIKKNRNLSKFFFGGNEKVGI
jgi:hypothetical protein